jgi:hypothetical protein
MNKLPLRGVIAPVFVAVAIDLSIFNFRRSSESMIWLNLLRVPVGISFAPDTRRLFDRAIRAVRGDSSHEHAIPIITSAEAQHGRRDR